MQEKEKRKREVERLRSLLYMNYIFHHRLYNLSQREINPNTKKTTKVDRWRGEIKRKGYLFEEDILRFLRIWHNIPKKDCPLITKSLIILGLLHKEDGIYKILPPKKSIEELRFLYKKKLKLV